MPLMSSQGAAPETGIVSFLLVGGRFALSVEWESMKMQEHLGPVCDLASMSSRGVQLYRDLPPASDLAY